MGQRAINLSQQLKLLKGGSSLGICHPCLLTRPATIWRSSKMRNLWFKGKTKPTSHYQGYSMQWKYQFGKSAAIGKLLPLNALAELGHPEESEKKAIKDS